MAATPRAPQQPHAADRAGGMLRLRTATRAQAR